MKEKTIHEAFRQIELRGRNLDNWLIFSISFFRLSTAGSYFFLNKNLKNKTGKSDNLIYIGIVFNIRHGIEILLKHLYFLYSDDLGGKDKNNKYKTHDIKRIFEKLLEKIKKNVKEKEEIKKALKKLEELVLKYQYCDFIKDKIDNNFEIEDFDNTAFKYPENNLNIKLDYSEILKKDKIKEDIEMFFNDSLDLLEILVEFDKYLSIQKNNI